LIEADADLRLPLVAGLPNIAAEVLYAVRHEMALAITDVLTRRTRLAMLAGATTLTGAERVADIMARELGWSAAERSRQLEDLRQELVREYLAPDQSQVEANQPALPA
jgi:glycerol-3-phosphate dehydrogenase